MNKTQVQCRCRFNKKLCPFVIGLLILWFTASAFSTRVFAHGESEKGPHGGYIRMPGAFHTELVPQKDLSKFKIYLLDIGFKNPTVEGSSIKVTYSGASTQEAQCAVVTNYYDCQFQSKISKNSGTLIIDATRMGVTGDKASYNLPLKIVKMKHK